MQIKKFLPGLLLGILFIGVFMFGFNSFNPGNSGAETAPSLQTSTSQTGQEVPTAPAPGDGPASQTAIDPGATPVAEPPAVASIPDNPVATSPIPENSDKVPAVNEPVAENPVVINEATESQEIGQAKESQEKGKSSKEHEQEDDSD